MADTNIEWADAVWNPVTGCDKISPGCKHCYASDIADRFWSTQYPPVRDVDGKERPRGFTDVQCHPDRLTQPHRWTKRKRVFVNSMSDLFHEDVPDEFIHCVFAVMERESEHEFYVLTKRHERMRSFINDRLVSSVSPHIIIGVTAEDQRYGKPRIKALQETKASRRMVSFEPLLEDMGMVDLVGINWAIIGGESGHHARPFRPEWARSLMAQCRAFGTAVFIKQMGGHVVDRNDAGVDADETGNAGYGPAWPEGVDIDHDRSDFSFQGADMVVKLKSKKGGTMTEWPADLRVREWP